MVQHFRLIEKDVSKPTAENHTKKRAAGDEITDSLRSKISVTPFGQHAQQRIAGAEGEHVRQTIPTWSDVFRKMENEWIEIVQVVSQHCCGFSVMFANAATQTKCCHRRSPDRPIASGRDALCGVPLFRDETELVPPNHPPTRALPE